MKAATQAEILSFPARLPFQSTPPVKAATRIWVAGSPSRRFQSTPPVKAATCGQTFRHDGGIISIHAAREGGDLAILPLKCRKIISIHAAREGGDACCSKSGGFVSISIHAAREGGDFAVKALVFVFVDFNPRRP